MARPLRELDVPPSALQNVRIMGELSKRSSAWPRGWGKRHCILSGNLLYVFASPAATQAVRVILVDGATLTACEAGTRRPFAIKLLTRCGFEYWFSGATADERDKWMAAIQNANYTAMFSRTKDAVRFLERAKDSIAPFLAREDGVAVPADAWGVADANAAPSSTAVTPADTQKYVKLRDGLTGADIVGGILLLRSRLMDTSANLAASLKALRQADTAEVERTVTDLRAANAMLESRVAELSAQLAAQPPRDASSSSPPAPQRATSAGDTAAAGQGVGQGGLLAWFRTPAASASTAAAVATVVPSPAEPGHEPPPAPIEGAASVVAAPVAVAADAAAVETEYEHEWAAQQDEGSIFEREGRFADAEQRYASVLAAKVRRCGAESSAVAATHRDMGRVLALQRKFDDSERHYAAAVKSCSELLGEAHPNTACALTDLAAVLREQNKFADAERYAQRAVESLKLGVGPDDVSTGTALYNLAGLSKRQGKFEAAAEAYATALRIFRDRLGEGVGETADTLYQMGGLAKRTGDTVEAARYFQASGEAYAAAYGADDKRAIEATKRARAALTKAAIAPTPVREPVELMSPTGK